MDATDFRQSANVEVRPPGDPNLDGTDGRDFYKDSTTPREINKKLREPLTPLALEFGAGNLVPKNSAALSTLSEQPRAQLLARTDKPALTIVDEMRAAGFDDATIGAWANEQRPAMKEAGFDDATIEGYFSGLKAPGTIPRPFLKRFLSSTSLADAAVEGAKAGFGDQPLGTTAEDRAGLRASGIYNDFAAPGGPIGGPVQYLRMANETVIEGAVTAVGAMFRGVNAGLMGAGAVGGQLISELSGQGESDQAKARRDWAHMVTFGAMLAGTVSPVVKPGSVVNKMPNDVTLGHLPTAEDFTAAAKLAAKIVQDENSKTVVTINGNDFPMAPAKAAPAEPPLPLFDHAPAKPKRPTEYEVTGASLVDDENAVSTVRVLRDQDGKIEAVNTEHGIVKVPPVAKDLPDEELITRTLGGHTTTGEFVGPSKVVAKDAEAAPAFDHVSATARDKTIQLYEEHGRHPSEVSAEMQANPEIARAIMSNDPAELPAAYVGYHASPHTFDAFDSAKIGSGEAAATDYPPSYGHGHYIADEIKVSEQYQKDAINDNHYNAMYWLRKAGGDKTRAIELMQADGRTLNQGIVDAMDAPHGNMYKVKVTADRNLMLDWDKPLKDQTPGVRGAIARIYEKFYKPEFWRGELSEDLQSGLTAEAFYNRLVERGANLSDRVKAWQQGGGGGVLASRILEDAGIHGIQYLDAHSRVMDAGGKTTSNTVIFNDKHLEITHRNGERRVTKAERDEAIALHAAIPPDSEVTQRIADKIAADYPAARREYEALPDADGGKVMNTDTARELSPDYAASKPARSYLAAAVHEPVSAFTKRLYADKLAELPPDSTVMFTAGGAGAGKSSAIKSLPAAQKIKDNAALVYDTNMNNFESSRTKVDQALAAGARVDIVMVQRDPIDALTEGALPRAMKMGRTVRLDAHAETHRGAAETIVKLADHYKDNPKVKFTILDNTGKAGEAKETDLAFLHGYDYFNLEGRLKTALKEQYDKERISHAVYYGTLGEEYRPAEGPRVPSRLSEGDGRGNPATAGRGAEARLDAAQSGAREANPRQEVTAAVSAALDAGEAITTGTKPVPEYAPDKVVAPAGPLQPAGHFMFPVENLHVDAQRFQFKSDSDAQGVNKALSGVTQWDTSKAGGIVVWQQKDGTLFVADGHQRTGLARRLMSQGHEPIEIPGVLYREVDGVSSGDAMEIAASANIANGSGSALDGAKVLRNNPALINGSIPLSTGKGKQAVALARLNDEAFGLVVNEVVPENYGAVVGELIPTDGARQVAALKAIARFEPRNVDEAAALVNRVKAAELAKADKGAQGSMFGDLETAESTAGEEMKIVGRAIADLKKDKTLFARVVANAERIEQTGSKIEQERAQSVATDAEKFARILASDAYSAGPIRTVLVAAAKDLKNGHVTIGDSAARVVAALRGETADAVADRNGAGGKPGTAARAEGGGDGAKPEPAPGTYHKPVEQAGTGFEPGADGKPQGLIPGVEPIKPPTVKEQLIAAAEKPMTGGDKPADGLFGNSMNEPQLFDAKPRTIFEQATDRAKGQDILDGAEGGAPKGLSAAATADPYTIAPAGILPAGTLVTAARDAAMKVASIWRDIQMNTAPMVLGSPAARAVLKDFANVLRRIRYDWSRADDAIVKAFPDRESRARMWSASDEESVAIQLGESREHQGLVTLTADERAMVEQLQTRMQATWVNARDVGMVEGEGLPSYTPRMLINVATGEGKTPQALNAIGGNVATTSARLRHRAHMMDFETEAAGKERFGEDVELARDIRSYPLAVASLEKAIAGRQLINDIKEIGKRAGTETVAEGGRPAGGQWFTIDHPAFKTWRPRLERGPERTDGMFGPEAGKWQTVKDAEGNIIFDQVPIHVHKDFEGPIRAVLDQRSGEFYKAAMDIKGRTMSVIMNSPLIHNFVEYGRAFASMPGRMITFRVYRDGKAMLADPALMREAIDHGMVPIGNRAFNQDITSVMEAPELKAGRSLTANALAETFGNLPQKGMTRAEVKQSVREGVDQAGNFWHNTLLWDQVAKLQAGLYTNIKADLMAKGVDETTAQYMAAHMSNRYAGAIPKEAMGHGATVIANSLLFSRSFTMGNLGVIKDMINGLPRDVMAQIERDVGSVSDTAVSHARKIARNKAIAIVVTDIVLFHVLNSILQSVINVISGRKDTEQEVKGYAERLGKQFETVKETPSALLHPFAILENLSSTSENEPGKRNSVYVGNTKDGTAFYARNTIGKLGEEFESWGFSPLEMLRKKEGTIFRPLMQWFANDKGFGRKVYDPHAETYEEMIKNVAAVGAHLAMAQTPQSQVSAAYDLATGQGDKRLNALQAFGPLLGTTFSKGAPGGPAVGEMYAWHDKHKFIVDSKLPGWRRQIQNGDAAGAVEDMINTGVPKGLTQFYVRTSLYPETRLTARAMHDFYTGANPEQRSRMEDTLKRQGQQRAQ